MIYIIISWVIKC